MHKPKVYIIIVNYEAWKDTIECLESLYKLTYLNFQIIVVDNCSPNQSLEKIKEWALGNSTIDIQVPQTLQHLVYPYYPKPIDFQILTENETLISNKKLILVQANKNGGFSYGNNIALQLALQKKDLEYAWILNNDTIVESSALSYLVEYAEKTENKARKVGLIGSKIMYYQDSQLIQCVGGARFSEMTTLSKQIGGEEIDQGQYDSDIQNLDLIAGASMFVSRNFLEDVGLLAEEYFLYFEEMDWAKRAKNKKWSLGYAHQAKIYHKEGASTGGGNKKFKKEVSVFAEYYFQKNRLIYAKKFGSTFSKICIYFIFFLIFCNKLRKFQWLKAKNMLYALLNPYKPYPRNEP